MGTIKHTSHSYGLDKPGKDGKNPLDKLTPLFKEADMIICEGYIHGPWKKLKVWRKKTNPEPGFIQKRELKLLLQIIT